MIAVIDYGAGNLFSVCNALRYLDLDHVVSRDAGEIAAADGIILPGVGAFADAMEKLTATGLVALLQEEAEKKPFLGICLGHQLLFEEGREFGITKGLGLLPGIVRELDAGGQKLPHIGWNTAHLLHDCPLTEGISDDSYFSLCSLILRRHRRPLRRPRNNLRRDISRHGLAGSDLWLPVPSGKNAATWVCAFWKNFSGGWSDDLITSD